MRVAPVVPLHPAQPLLLAAWTPVCPRDFTNKARGPCRTSATDGKSQKELALGAGAVIAFLVLPIQLIKKKGRTHARTWTHVYT